MQKCVPKSLLVLVVQEQEAKKIPHKRAVIVYNAFMKKACFIISD